MKPSSRLLCAALLGATALFDSSCSNGPDRSEAEAARRAVVPMSADEIFLGGKIAAHLTLGSSLAEHHAGGPGLHGGHGGGRHGGGGMGGGHRQRNEDTSDSETGSEVRTQYGESPMPPALLRLSLKNTSTAAIDVEIRDLNSELGNFALRPDKFTLAPGEVGEPDAMQSLLGVESMALPVTLTLRAGGQTETKVLTLRPVTPAAK